MRNILLLISFIFIITLPASAMPGFNPDDNEPIVYDTSYNIALRKKLEDDYSKKYPPVVTKTKDCTTYTYNYPFGAYEKEVVIPYYRNAKSYKDTIIKQ